jgi:hypothetical protein
MIEVPAYLDSPVLHDKVIQDLQQAFAAESWCQLSFPLAAKVEIEDRVMPAVWDGVDYIPLEPTDDTISMCFFEMLGADRLDDEDEWFRYNLALVFWFQLSEVYVKSYDYTTEMIQLAKNVLKNNGCYDMSYTIVPEEVFEGYDIEVMKDKSCFRIEFTKEN